MSKPISKSVLISFAVVVLTLGATYSGPTAASPIIGLFSHGNGASRTYVSRNTHSHNTSPTLLSPSQSNWAMTFGGPAYDRANAIAQTDDGGYVIAGNLASASAWVLKLDASGEVLWQKTYTDGSASAHAMHPTNDGGYIIAGDTSNGSAFPGSAAIWVAKVDASGIVQWQQSFAEPSKDSSENTFANSIEPTSDGGYVIAGEGLPGQGNYDALVVKLDASGNIMWQKDYRGAGDSSVQSIKPTADGGYVVAGDMSGMAWISKLDGAGNLIWQKTLGIANLNYLSSSASSIDIASDESYVVAGWTKLDSPSYSSGWIAKLSSSGAVRWKKIVRGSGSDSLTSVVATKDGGYVVAGDTGSFGPGGIGAWLFKLDEAGKLVWDYSFGGSGLERAFGVIPTRDGGYAIAGASTSFGAGDYDAWVLKLDEY